MTWMFGLTISGMYIIIALAHSTVLLSEVPEMGKFGRVVASLAWPIVLLIKLIYWLKERSKNGNSNEM